jgi:RNA polymerase Rpb1, domain 2
MCRTPTGNILPPHSLSFRSGDIRTQYYIASSKAFENDSTEYINALKRTNYGKEGHLRSVMSTPVSGSARLVCVPHDHSDPWTVFLSPNLASKVVFCLPETLEDGTLGARYVERSLQEGDFVMVERAPSLSKFNNQPLRLSLWDIECMGVHPKVFSYFHGDYDGDECHMYALGHPSSLAEALQWRPPLDRNLCGAEAYMAEHFPGVCEEVDGEGGLEFLEYTTLSFDEIKNGDYELPMGDLVRNKKAHLDMFKEKMGKRKGTEGFLQDAVKGVKDIMRQQISQGRIGDMSRVARISAMCFTRGKEGGTFVVTRRSRVLLNRSTEGSTGCPAVRCVMVLCQASQEAALHAHRVGSTESAGVDLVSCLLRGRAEGNESAPQDTLVIMEGVEVEDAKRDLGASWGYAAEGVVALVVKDDKYSARGLGKLVGAFSPIVLSKVPEHRRRSVCKAAVCAVYNYYKLELEGDDVEDMVEMMCYRVELSSLPITTREGMLSRGLGWMETLMACDYTKLPQLAGSTSRANTATSATMCSNFSLL